MYDEYVPIQCWVGACLFAKHQLHCSGKDETRRSCKGHVLVLIFGAQRFFPFRSCSWKMTNLQPSKHIFFFGQAIIKRHPPKRNRLQTISLLMWFGLIWIWFDWLIDLIWFDLDLYGCWVTHKNPSTSAHTKLVVFSLQWNDWGWRIDILTQQLSFDAHSVSLRSKMDGCCCGGWSHDC